MQNETSFSHRYRQITRIPFTIGHHLREKQEKERLRTFLKEVSYPKSAVKLTETKLTFNNLFIYLFIYFSLHWVFAAASRLSLVAAL